MVRARILLVTPTSLRWDEAIPDVQSDLDRMSRRGVDVTYRTTDAGPRDVRSATDAAQAAPHVVALICAAEADGFDAVIVDCTDDPGVAEARRVVSIPVVGPGAALRDAIIRAPQPVVELLGDDLPSLSFGELASVVGDAPTIAIVGTGTLRLPTCSPVCHINQRCSSPFRWRLMIVSWLWSAARVMVGNRALPPREHTRNGCLGTALV